jgi:hypothetical protein
MLKKPLILCGCLVIFGFITMYLPIQKTGKIYVRGYEEGEQEEKERMGEDGEGASEYGEGYSNPKGIALEEFEKTKDPALGYVPIDRLWNAIEFTNFQKEIFSTARMSSSYAWTARGPIYDVVGPSNGNTRANNEYTSGRMRAILVDASDATGHTVFAAGISGGLWKTTNFLTQPTNWTIVGDNFSSIAISSICQDPTNPDIMYFSTGEGPVNSDAVNGRGVWKSTNHGSTWTQLAATTNYWRCFKLICDASGNLYLALRTTASPLPTQTSGLVRSTDGGTTWTNITPSGLTSSSSDCTDIEISSTGTLHASFGYSLSPTTGASNYRYTTTPSTVTSGTWASATAGMITAANRIELATQGNVVYAAFTNNLDNISDLYRSTDGGVNWSKRNAATLSSAISNTQGWYCITLAINPNYTDSVIIGGLDAYLSVNGGADFNQMTYWVGATAPYVHADHHFTQWYTVAGERRIIIGCDGGIFLSRNNGSTFTDRNRNLSLKQFYSISLHPSTTNYMLAGAQDNGSHQLNGAGLTSSVEVTGGDGAFVHIDQDEPQYQFTSYVRNRYRRSTNGGTSWSAVDLSTTQGLFINPFDYDDNLDVMYCSNGVSSAPNNQVRRWDNPQTGSTNTILTLSALTRTSNSNPTSFAVSPYTANRVYIGSSRGVLVRLDNASTVTAGTANANTTAIGSASFPVGTINCVAVGTTDNNLLAIFSNYGISNVWFTNNGGTTWTACDGNLPDMPVRWAIFKPGSNTEVMLATEAGVYNTDNLNGGSTVWTANPGFPTVRTNMLKVRTVDNTIAAATHGRGIFTANFNIILPVRDITLQASLAGNGKSLLTWNAVDVTNDTRFMVQYSTDGSRFMDITELGSGARRYEHAFGATTGYYRIIGNEDNLTPVFSNIVSVKNNKPVKGIQMNVFPNPAITNTSIELTTNNKGGRFEWTLINNSGQLIQRGTGNLPEAGRIYQPINAAVLPKGRYSIRLTINDQLFISSFIKQ